MQKKEASEQLDNKDTAKCRPNLLLKSALERLGKHIL